MLSNNKNEHNSQTHNNMDECQMHANERNQAFIWNAGKGRTIVIGNRLVFAWSWKSEGGLTTKWHKGNVVGDEIVPFLGCGGDYTTAYNYQYSSNSSPKIN